MISKQNDQTRDHSYAILLTDREVDRATCGTLLRNGWPEEEIEDGLADVRLRVIAAIHRGEPPPPTLRAMRAFCAKVAKDHAIDRLRKRETAEKWSDGLCEDPDEVAALVFSGEPRDPVDAARQLELAAELFREGKMPEHGVDILEGVASGCSYAEVGEDLGLTHWAVKGRLKTMRKRFSEAIVARRMG